MSTQIDPLTGLPMVFDNIIEQIPLDAQIFPYADLGATARPTAPPLYPDSIIPVSAFLSGQHPDTGSAQTVATNGDHDLRVHVTNPATGGGAAPTVKSIENEQLVSGTNGSNKGVAFGIGPITAIWGIHYVVLFYPPGNAGHNTSYRFYSWLENPNDSSKQFHIVQGMWSTANTAPDMNKGWIEQEHWFPVGHDPSAYLGVTDGIYDWYCRSQLFPYDFEVYLKYV